jgi:hypothetical protein
MPWARRPRNELVLMSADGLSRPLNLTNGSGALRAYSTQRVSPGPTNPRQPAPGSSSPD